MKTKTKNRFIWLAGGMTLAVVATFAAWNHYGFAEYAQTAKADYARIEAAGFPLDAKSYAASLAVPDDQNNGQPLYDALSSIEEEMKRLDVNSYSRLDLREPRRKTSLHFERGPIDRRPLAKVESHHGRV